MTMATNIRPGRSKRKQRCTRCGGKGPFRSDRAFLCDNCLDERDAEYREESNRYFQARHRAMKRLREEFPQRWEELLAEERAAEDVR